MFSSRGTPYNGLYGENYMPKGRVEISRIELKRRVGDFAFKKRCSISTLGM